MEEIEEWRRRRSYLVYCMRGVVQLYVDHALTANTKSALKEKDKSFFSLKLNIFYFDYYYDPGAKLFAVCHGTN